MGTEPPSGKKPGGQPGNQNAAKDGAGGDAYTAAFNEHKALTKQLAELEDAMQSVEDGDPELDKLDAKYNALWAQAKAAKAKLEAASPKLDKKHVSAVKAVYPNASSDDHSDVTEDGSPKFVIMEDSEESDGVIGSGPTEAHAWADAFARLNGGGPGGGSSKPTPTPDPTGTDEPTGKKFNSPSGLPQAEHNRIREELKAKAATAKTALQLHMMQHGMEAMVEGGKHYHRSLELSAAAKEADRLLYRHDNPEKDMSDKEYKDVGEKIGGARKDTWRAIEDGSSSFNTIDWDALEQEPEQAARVITRNNLLAHSTPEAMRESGMPANVAYLAHQMLMTIGQKPELDSHLARKVFAKAIDRVQRAVMHARSVDDLNEVRREIRAEMHGFHMEPDEKARHDELQAKYQAIANREKAAEEVAKPLYSAWKEAESALGEVKYNRRIKDEAKRAELMKPLQAAVDAAHAAWWPKQEIVNGIRDERRQVSQEIYRERDVLEARDRANPESWHNAYKMLGSRFDTMLKGGGAVWETHYPKAKRGAADDWAWHEKSGEAKPKGERKAKERTLPEWERYSPETDERTGGRAIGKVKPEELADRFGFRAVEYGNYVSQDEAAHHTTKAAEAFQDMADALGLDPKQISYGGRLAMAFGARGKGRALAHYEGDKKVINITKEGGGGSLAHEWGHFFDNILAQVSHDGQGGHTSYLSKKEHGPAIDPGVKSAMEELIKAMHEGNHTPTVRQEPTDSKFYPNRHLDQLLESHGNDPQKVMDAAIAGTNGASVGGLRDPKQRKKWAEYLANKTGQAVSFPKGGQGSSEFFAIAAEMGEYWKRPHELFARAWESYVQDKCEAKGIRNSYLVSGTSEDSNWRHSGSRKASSFVYPQGEERAKCNAAFDKLIEAVKASGMLEKALQLADAADALELAPVRLRRDPMSGAVIGW